ncbi:hypothetical protein BC828DRAFT_377566 [Blastocladiella britannica]|nr:hypothetical protein BC828DRAFT_377566 [Blastocladiella britannica]
MGDVVRRTWNNLGAANRSGGGSSSAPPPLPAADAGPKLLQARVGRVNFESAVGKQSLVSTSASGQAQAGFYCSLCDRLLKDNFSYLDHLNSPFHLKRGGHTLEIKKATLADVRARIAFHKKRRALATEDYDMDKRIEAIKQAQLAEKLAKKQRRLEAKRARREEGETRASRSANTNAAGNGDEDDADPFGAAGPWPMGDGDDGDGSGSEYSDYDLDEHGNIVETGKKIKRVDPPPPPSIPIDMEESAEDEMARLMGFGSFTTTTK